MLVGIGVWFVCGFDGCIAWCYWRLFESYFAACYIRWLRVSGEYLDEFLFGVAHLDSCFRAGGLAFQTGDSKC
jgi:hypothetical protein